MKKDFSPGGLLWEPPRSPGIALSLVGLVGAAHSVFRDYLLAKKGMGKKITVDEAAMFGVLSGLNAILGPDEGGGLCQK